MANLTPDLEKARVQIEKVAEGYGLDFFETVFELVSYDEMNQIASFGGFPVRYPPLALGHGIRAHVQKLRVRAVKDL